MKKLLWISLVAGLVLCGVTLHWRGESAPQADARAFLGSSHLRDAYGRWVAQHELAGGDRNVRFDLHYSKGLSAELTQASGSAVLDLLAGRVELAVQNLDAGEYDVWLVDNRPAPGSSVQAEASDVRVNAGRLVRDGSSGSLRAELGAALFENLQVDLVVVSRAGEGAERGLLYGSSSLFQRLYTAFRTPALLAVSDYAPLAERAAAQPGFGIAMARAGGDSIFVDSDVLFNRLVATGADLFVNGTFNGNGRTCATCHPMARNTQLSASDIAAFPDRDPLFAAEFQPALAFSPSGPKFEVPPLMRGAALIVENQDGMGDLVNNFNMRGIPHTLALSTSITAPPGPGPAQRTGWSGDGAPNTGALRDFATGAVTQHFPKRLARVPGVDFRLPTEKELDAMEAFQLSLGRQQDLVLPLSFSSPIVRRGQELFLATGPSNAGNCNICHNNAGANALFLPGKNFNFNTGVESLKDRPVHVILAALSLDLTPGVPENVLKPDGGFGASGDPTQGGQGQGSLVVGFGDGTFNAPPLVEAADSGPFFHDNSIRTIEGAVSFYNSTAFANSPSGQLAPTHLEPTQVEAIAAFLRALNALENLRAAAELVQTADNVRVNPRIADELGEQAAAEIGDAIRVLSGADLHGSTVLKLGSILELRQRGGGFPKRHLRAILRRLEEARAEITGA